jgi:hypothetical protein
MFCRLTAADRDAKKEFKESKEFKNRSQESGDHPATLHSMLR